jgi:hypothetical protein
MEGNMKKANEPTKPSKPVKAAAARPQPAKGGKDPNDPCEKAFNQETARLNDKDEACDDGVR